MSRTEHGLTPELIAAIVRRYETDGLLVSSAYADGGTDYLRARLEGVLMNQIESGDAMPARYAIWANTVRDNIIAGLRAFEDGEASEGSRYLTRAANNLSAFSDAQAYLDKIGVGKRTYID